MLGALQRYRLCTVARSKRRPHHESASLTLATLPAENIHSGANGASAATFSRAKITKATVGGTITTTIPKAPRDPQSATAIPTVASTGASSDPKSRWHESHSPIRRPLRSLSVRLPSRGSLDPRSLALSNAFFPTHIPASGHQEESPQHSLLMASKSLTSTAYSAGYAFIREWSSCPKYALPCPR